MAWNKRTQLSLIQVDTNDDVFQTGGALNSPFSGCSYSPQSRRSSDASSMSSAAEAATPSSATGSVATPDDVFGLKGLYYCPAIASEIGRLFFPAVAAASVAAETNTQKLKSVWDDFDQNGTNMTLDNLDRLQRGMSSSELESPPRRNRTLSSADRTLSTAEETFQDIVTKAGLIDILRERENVQRANRSMTRMSSTPKSGTKTKSAIRSCVFCRNNGEAESVSSSHTLKDPEGNVTCPILYIYTCPICGASGKDAHTIKYCPYSTGETPSVTRSGASRPPSMRPNSFF